MERIVVVLICLFLWEGVGSFVRWYYLQYLVSFISCMFWVKLSKIGVSGFYLLSRSPFFCFVFGTLKYAPSYLIVRGNLKLKVA